MNKKYLTIVFLIAISILWSCNKKNTDGKKEVEKYRKKAQVVLENLEKFSKNVKTLMKTSPKIIPGNPPAGIKPSCNVMNIANSSIFNDLFLYRKDFKDLAKEENVDERIFHDTTVRKAIGILKDGVLIGGTARLPITGSMETYEVEAIKYNLKGIATINYIFVVDVIEYYPALVKGLNEFKPGKIKLRATLFDLKTQKYLDTIEAKGVSSKGVTTREYQTGLDKVSEDLREAARDALSKFCRKRYGVERK
jgi:hypothetical protein